MATIYLDDCPFCGGPGKGKAGCRRRGRKKAARFFRSRAIGGPKRKRGPGMAMRQGGKDIPTPFRHGWIGCPECGIYKNWTNSPREAVRIWNTRVRAVEDAGPYEETEA